MRRNLILSAGITALLASEQNSGSVALQFADGQTRLKVVDLAAVANKTRLMPAEYLDPGNSHVSDAYMSYLGRLLPARPQISTLAL